MKTPNKIPSPINPESEVKNKTKRNLIKDFGRKKRYSDIEFGFFKFFVILTKFHIVL